MPLLNDYATQARKLFEDFWVSENLEKYSHQFIVVENETPRA